jgi:hypothetical protein
MTNKIDPQIEFPKVEKMLCSLAWKVAQACPVTFEESRSEAYLAFMLACQTYDSRRGSKFSSWCYFKVWTSLRSWITKRTRDPLICTEMNDELTGFAPEQRGEIMDMIGGLSEDAQEIISLLLETPAEILEVGRISSGPRRGQSLDLGNKMTPKQLLARVKEYLRSKGLDKRRIERAQREIELRFWEVWAH